MFCLLLRALWLSSLLRAVRKKHRRLINSLTLPAFSLSLSPLRAPSSFAMPRQIWSTGTILQVNSALFRQQEATA